MVIASEKAGVSFDTVYSWSLDDEGATIITLMQGTHEIGFATWKTCSNDFCNGHLCKLLIPDPANRGLGHGHKLFNIIKLDAVMAMKRKIEWIALPIGQVSMTEDELETWYRRQGARHSQHNSCSLPADMEYDLKIEHKLFTKVIGDSMISVLS